MLGSVYNASKAALHQYSDTLRVELAPFGVKVVVVVTGGVKSQIARTKRTLPTGSYYISIEDEYEARQVHSQANSIPSDDYAKAVYNQIAGAWFVTPRWTWAGGQIWKVWFGLLFPRGVLVCRFPKQNEHNFIR